MMALCATPVLMKNRCEEQSGWPVEVGALIQFTHLPQNSLSVVDPDLLTELGKLVSSSGALADIYTPLPPSTRTGRKFAILSCKGGLHHPPKNLLFQCYPPSIARKGKRQREWLLLVDPHQHRWDEAGRIESCVYLQLLLSDRPEELQTDTEPSLDNMRVCQSAQKRKVIVLRRLLHHHCSLAHDRKQCTQLVTLAGILE